MEPLTAGHADAAEDWKAVYEEPNFAANTKQLFDQVNFHLRGFANVTSLELGFCVN